MDGMLSQDEINALLSGMDVSSMDDSSEASGAPADSTPESGGGSSAIDGDLLTPTEMQLVRLRISVWVLLLRLFFPW